MAHHPGRESGVKKVKLRFAIAETEILDKLIIKEIEKPVLKGVETSVNLAEKMRKSLKKNVDKGSEAIKARLAVGTKGSGPSIVGKKIDVQDFEKRSLGHEAKSARGRRELVTNMMKEKEVTKGEDVFRTAKEDGDMGVSGKVKLEPFLPNFSSLSNFSIRVPKQHVQDELGSKGKAHNLPPLPEESSLFLPPSRTLTGIQEIARQLLLCLEPVDTGVTLDLHHLAAELNVDVKRIFLVSNVMEAVGMLSRISISKVIWKGKEAMYQSLVQLHRLAVQENILQQIHAADLKAQSDLLNKALVGGGVSEEDKVKVTTGVITQRLLMAFLAVPSMSIMSTNMMGKVISSMGNVRCPQSRLPDLANVLIGIGLLQKVEVVEQGLSKPRKSTAFQYAGPVVEEVD